MDTATQQQPPAQPASSLSDEALLNDLAAQADAPLPGAAPAAPAGPPTSAVLEGVLAPAFLIFAPNWNVHHNEVKQLAEAYGLVIDKYFPDGMSAFGPELMAFTMTAMVVVPRLNTPMKAVPKPKAKDASPG